MTSAPSRLSQRTLAGLIAAPLVLALLIAAWVVPLPYVVYRPGLTVDVLGQIGDEPIVEVSGRPAYDDGGQLRMTTVSVTRPDANVTLPELLGAWASRADAVYPWDAVYESGTTNEANREEGAVQMASSQDVATAVALKELGQSVATVVRIAGVEEGLPADGVLEEGDVVLTVAGERVTDTTAAVERIRATPEGGSVELGIRRDGADRTVSITPDRTEGTPRIGATVAQDYDFPFDVTINVDPDIGGPSAGLMFSLAIFDVLTPGSLTGGRPIAGSGEIATDGTVGPIGGIQQKIAGAERDGAELFLVPAANCADALGADRDDLRLVRVTTMHSAVEALETWTEDADAALPSCEGEQS